MKGHGVRKGARRHLYAEKKDRQKDLVQFRNDQQPPKTARVALWQGDEEKKATFFLGGLAIAK